MSKVEDKGHRRGVLPPSAHRRSPKGKSRESAPKQSTSASALPLAQFVNLANQKIKTFSHDVQTSARQFTRAAKAFSYTLATRATQTNLFKAAKDAIAATQHVMGPKVDYLQLAEQLEVMITAIRQQKNPDATTRKLLANLAEQYRTVIAIGLSNATLEYHIASKAADRHTWQRAATVFADKVYEDNPREMQSVVLLLAAYSNVDLDLAAIRHRIRQSKIIVAAPEFEPVPLPNQDPSAYGSNPAAAAAYAADPKVAAARAHVAAWQPVMAQTERHILGVIQKVHSGASFYRATHQGIALEIMGRPDRALAKYLEGRAAFTSDDAFFRAPKSADHRHKLASEIALLHRIAQLPDTDTRSRQQVVGEAYGLIEWIEHTYNHDQALLFKLGNLDIKSRLNIADIHGRSDALSMEAAHAAITREYDDVIRFCANARSKNPKVRAAIHDQILTTAADRLSHQLDSALMLYRIGSTDEAEALRHSSKRAHDSLVWKYKLSATDDAVHEVTARAVWSAATYDFHTGKMENVQRAIGALKTIQADHPETAVANILRHPDSALWIRKFNIVDENGKFSKDLGTPSRTAALCTAVGKLTADKTTAMKAIGIGAGVGLGVAAADALAGTHVLGTLSLGQTLLMGAAVGLGAERANRLLSNYADISASYQSGISHLHERDVAMSAAGFGIEVGAMFAGGFAGRIAKTVVTRSLFRLGEEKIMGWMLSRGMTIGPAELAAGRFLVEEIGIGVEAVVFHPTSSLVTTVAQRAAGMPTHEGGSYFDSWFMLRTLGLAEHLNLAGLLVSGKFMADNVARTTLNMAGAQVAIQLKQSITSGDFSHFGRQYGEGLIGLLAITLGQKTAGALFQLPAHVAKAKQLLLTRQIRIDAQLARKIEHLLSDIEYAESAPERLRLNQLLIKTLQARATLMQKFARNQFVPQEVANAFSADVQRLARQVRAEAAVAQASTRMARRDRVRTAVASLGGLRQLGGGLMIIPIRVAENGTATFEMGLDGLQMPVSKSAERADVALAEAARHKRINAWVAANIRGKDISAQIEATVRLLHAYQQWAATAQERILAAYSNPDMTSRLGELYAEFKWQDTSYRHLLQACQGAVSDDFGTVVSRLTSNVVQVTSMLGSHLEMTGHDIRDGHLTAAELPEERRELEDGLKPKTNLYPKGMVIPLHSHESARAIVGWLDKRLGRVDPEKSGVYIWEGVAQDHPEISGDERVLHEIAWPPRPEDTPALRTYLKYLGWTMRVENNGQRVVIDTHHIAPAHRVILDSNQEAALPVDFSCMVDARKVATDVSFDGGGEPGFDTTDLPTEPNIRLPTLPEAVDQQDLGAMDIGKFHPFNMGRTAPGRHRLIALTVADTAAPDALAAATAARRPQIQRWIALEVFTDASEHRVDNLFDAQEQSCVDMLGRVKAARTKARLRKLDAEWRQHSTLLPETVSTMEQMAADAGAKFRSLQANPAAAQGLLREKMIEHRDQAAAIALQRRDIARHARDRLTAKSQPMLDAVRKAIDDRLAGRSVDVENRFDAPSAKATDVTPPGARVPRLGILGDESSDMPPPRPINKISKAAYVTASEFQSALVDLFPKEYFTAPQANEERVAIMSRLAAAEVAIDHQQRTAIRSASSDADFPPIRTDTYLARSRTRATAWHQLLDLQTASQLARQFGHMERITDMDVEAVRTRILTAIISQGFHQLPPPRGHIDVNTDYGVVVLSPEFVEDFRAIESGPKSPDSLIPVAGIYCYYSALGIPIIVISPEVHNHRSVLKHELRHHLNHPEIARATSHPPPGLWVGNNLITEDTAENQQQRRLYVNAVVEHCGTEAKDEVLAHLIQSRSPKDTLARLLKKGGPYDFVERHNSRALEPFLNIPSQTMRTLLGDPGKLRRWRQHLFAEIRKRHDAEVTQRVHLVYDAVETMVERGYHPEVARHFLADKLHYVAFDDWRTQIPKILKNARVTPPPHDMPAPLSPNDPHNTIRAWVDAEAARKRRPLNHAILEVMKKAAAEFKKIHEILKERQTPETLTDLRQRFRTQRQYAQQVLEVLQTRIDEAEAHLEVLQLRHPHHSSRKISDAELELKKRISLFKAASEAFNVGRLAELQLRIDQQLLIHTAHAQQMIQDTTREVGSLEDAPPAAVPTLSPSQFKSFQDLAPILALAKTDPAYKIALDRLAETHPELFVQFTAEEIGRMLPIERQNALRKLRQDLLGPDSHVAISAVASYNLFIQQPHFAHATPLRAEYGELYDLFMLTQDASTQDRIDKVMTAIRQRINKVKPQKP